jgi:MraZ protein
MVVRKEEPRLPMDRGNKRTVFVGTFHHSVDDKNRVAVPAKWRAASGSQEFFVLPDPKDCLLVLEAAAMEKMLEVADNIRIGEYDQRDGVRLIASAAHQSDVDKQGRISLTDALLDHAGIKDEAVLVGTLNRFEIWSPERWKKFQEEKRPHFAVAATQMQL